MSGGGGRPAPRGISEGSGMKQGGTSIAPGNARPSSDAGPLATASEPR